jgi:dTDP-glucose 4,6-dehydratase
MVNILVTGGCGFIGSHFINYILQKYPDYFVVNIDALYYCSNYNKINESKKYKFIKGNLQSPHIINHILNEYNIQWVIHFAAQSHVQNSFNESILYTMDNVVGTHVLLEECRKYNKIEKFIHVSTDEVYGESLNNDQKLEKSLLCPTNPYAATKAAAELIAQSYIHSYKLPIIITRGNNVYGPNQYPEKVIPRFIEQLKGDKQITIQGDGSARRSFLHVYDTCTAFDTILHKGVIGEIYNIGTPVEYSIMDVARLLVKLVKGTDDFQSYVKFIEDRPFNDSRYFINNDKLKNLGWEITIDFHEGILSLIG